MNKKLSSTTLQAIPNGDAVWDTILKRRIKATKTYVYFLSKLTKFNEDSSKGSGNSS